MKKLKQQILFFAAVALLSSGVTAVTYQLMDRHDGIDLPAVFEQPVRYTDYIPARGGSTDFTVAAENSIHGVVHIKSTVSRQVSSPQMDMFEWFFGDRGFRRAPQQKQEGFGSGVIISADGYIVTNNHVIEGSDALEVTMNDKRVFKARLVGADPNTDLALLKIEAKDLPVIPFGDSDGLKIGEWVLAVGNPFNLTSTVTAGIVSAKARNINIINAEMKIESFIQTDAAVNPGNSGGALVNTKGELIGINTAIASTTGNYAGYSFAVPVSIVAKVVTDIKQYGTVQRAVLGVSIQDITSELMKSKDLLSLDGVYVAAVVDRSAAKDAGIQEGDVISKVNDVTVKSASELQEQVGRYRPGDKIKLSVIRDKKSKEISLILKNRQGNTSVTKQGGIEVLGAAFKPIDDSLKRTLGVSSGLQVTGVTEGKFKDNEIRKGFIILKVNNAKVAQMEELEKIVSQVQNNSNEQVLFIVGVYPNGRTAYYAIDLSSAQDSQ